MKVETQEEFYCKDLPTSPVKYKGTILVTGATGYIGGRLVPELIERGYKVRIMVRGESPEKNKLWPQVEIVVADALNKKTLHDALKGIYTAYYLIHSLHLGPEQFESKDILASKNFKEVAEEENVKRVIYLGGLGDTQTQLSPHLKNRMEVAEQLKQGKYHTTVLRAAIIIGSGSASYEIIKHLVLNLPILIIPKWSNSICQPISVRDVIKYLVGVLEMQECRGKSFDIGGKEILPYSDMIKIMTAVHCKKRYFIPFSNINISFLSYVTGLVTPVPAPLIKVLFSSLGNDVICQDNIITKLIPFKCLTYKEALLKAMSREEKDRVHTRWSDAYPPAHELAIKLHELNKRPKYLSTYKIETTKSPEILFKSICSIGGEEGWFQNNWMWRLRGMIDKLFYGVGTARGRKAYSSLNTNDVIDFWRVEDIIENRRLLLRAEMKLPGKAWLEFYIVEKVNKNVLIVKAYYDVKNLAGHLYWYLFLPFHKFIFKDLLKQLVKRN